MLKGIGNRCGEDISDSGKIGYMALSLRESIGGPVVQENSMKGYHFCVSCIEDIQEFAANPKESSKPKQTRRRAIDYPKIMALRSAGWSISKIAEEMGMTSSRVSWAIWYYKNRIQRQEEEDGSSGG